MDRSLHVVARVSLLGLLGWMALGCRKPGPEAESGLLPATHVFGTDQSRIAERRVWLVRSEEEWDAVWNRIRDEDGGRPRPSPDLGRGMLMVAAAGAGSSDGPEFSFDGYRVRGDSLFVHLCLRVPHLSTGPDDATTFAAVALLPRHDGPVTTVVRKRRGPC